VEAGDYLLGLQPFHLILVLKSIPYSDLAPFLNPKGPGINIVIGFVSVLNQLYENYLQI